MNRYTKILGSAALLISSPAMAQLSSSNCMAMGPNMVHCDTMSMAPTVSEGSSGHVIPDAFEDLLARGRNAKAGKMIAAGDCRGAMNFALQKGDFELAHRVQGLCQAPASQPSAAITTPARAMSPYEAGRAAALAANDRQ